MYGWEDLKETTDIGCAAVECPVRGCAAAVERDWRIARKEWPYWCPEHGIYLSHGTFAYDDEQRNMLWTDEDDLALWNAVRSKTLASGSRMRRENSEHAVIWNVFRYLEKHGLLGDFVERLGGLRAAGEPAVMYWLYCRESGRAWQPMLDAAKTFGEQSPRRSVPDLVLDGGDVLVFVEAKLLTCVQSAPDPRNNPQRYHIGGGTWFRRVFQPTSSFQDIALTDGLYDFMRLWLLGSWLAGKAGKRFLLLSLVRAADKRESDADARFAGHLQVSRERTFACATWEQVFAGIGGDSPDARRLMHYLHNKTLGYVPSERRTRGRLTRAFAWP